MRDDLFMVFDVESLGLHGEGYAVGYILIDPHDGRELESGHFSTRPELAEGRPCDLEWALTNVVPVLRERPSATLTDGLGSSCPREVRDRFWARWRAVSGQRVRLAVEVPWPVEARFLRDCINDDYHTRAAHGPYPLIDIASVRMAAGFDPLATEERNDREMPPHNPLADARQSARLLVEALKKIRGKGV